MYAIMLCLVGVWPSRHIEFTASNLARDLSDAGRAQHQYGMRNETVRLIWTAATLDVFVAPAQRSNEEIAMCADFEHRNARHRRGSVCRLNRDPGTWGLVMGLGFCVIPFAIFHVTVSDHALIDGLVFGLLGALISLTVGVVAVVRSRRGRGRAWIGVLGILASLTALLINYAVLDLVMWLMQAPV